MTASSNPATFTSTLASTLTSYFHFYFFYYFTLTNKTAQIQHFCATLILRVWVLCYFHLQFCYKVPACQVDSGPGTHGSAEKDDLLVPMHQFGFRVDPSKQT